LIALSKKRCFEDFLLQFSDTHLGFRAPVYLNWFIRLNSIGQPCARAENTVVFFTQGDESCVKREPSWTEFLKYAKYPWNGTFIMCSPSQHPRWASASWFKCDFLGKIYLNEQEYGVLWNVTPSAISEHKRCCACCKILLRFYIPDNWPFNPFDTILLFGERYVVHPNTNTNSTRQQTTDYSVSLLIWKPIISLYR
jgi:hypothetical protein